MGNDPAFVESNDSVDFRAVGFDNGIICGCKDCQEVIVTVHVAVMVTVDKSRTFLVRDQASTKCPHCGAEDKKIPVAAGSVAEGEAKAIVEMEKFRDDPESVQLIEMTTLQKSQVKFPSKPENN